MNPQAFPLNLRRRIRELNGHPVQPEGRDYVLCWLQQTLRATDNPVLQVAQRVSLELRVPLLVYHGIGAHYPHASWRMHQFLLEASLSLERTLAAKGIWLRRGLERRDGRRGLVHQLSERAALVVTEDQPAGIARSYAWRLAARSRTAVWGVDSSAYVPINELTHPMGTYREFRQRHMMARKDPAPFELLIGAKRAKNFEGELPFEPCALEGRTSAELTELISGTGVDMSVPPVPELLGSRKAAMARLSWAIEHVLPIYTAVHDNPAEPESSSRLSPYLNFGVLSAHEVMLAVCHRTPPTESRRLFLDKLLRWRDYMFYLARRCDRPHDYSALPAAARASLWKHSHDTRETLYSRTQLLHGRTHDDVWNAAQRALLYEGYQQKKLFAFWANRLISWHRFPREAWETACFLYDRLALEGASAASYGNLRWSFGRGARSSVDQPVYGRVLRQSGRALMELPGMDSWIEHHATRQDYEVDA